MTDEQRFMIEKYVEKLGAELPQALLDALGVSREEVAQVIEDSNHL